MALKDYVRSALTGGGTGALDKIDGAGLNDGDMAKVVTDAGVYWYHLNATSGATENSPFRINPDSNAGTKSWHLVGTTKRIGARVKLTANESISNASSVNIPWGAESYDDGGFWSSGDSTKFTIPVGVTKVRLYANLAWDTNSTGRRVALFVEGASNSDFDGQARSVVSAESDTAISLVSDMIDVTTANFYALRIYQDSGGALNLLSDPATWFSIEAVSFG